MKKSTKFFLYLSIALNCFFIIAFTCLCIYKWNSITTRLEKLFSKNQPSEKVLSQFNKEPYRFLNEEEIYSDSSETITILFLGNSLTYTGVPEEEPDKTSRGLTSTSKERLCSFTCKTNFQRKESKHCLFINKYCRF